jgi:heptosyltransferase-2
MKKILIIRLSSLGDIILTFPVMKNIKLNDKNVKIVFLTKKSFSQILKGNADIDEVMEFDGLFKTIKKIKAEKFDVLIDLHSNLRSFFFRVFSGAKIKIKRNKDVLARLLFVKFRIISPRLEKDVVDKNLETLGRLNYKIYSREIELKNIEPASKSVKKADKILIIQTAFLGDVFFILPMIRELKSKLPGRQISVLVRKDNASALAGIREIDEIIEDRKKEKPFFAEIKRLVSLLKSKNFDTAVIPHMSLRSAVIAYFSGIKTRIGFDIFPASLFYTHKFPFKWIIHDSEINNMLITPITGKNSVVFPEINSVTGKSYEEILSIKPLILASPSSVWETKRWPAYKFAEFIRKIYSRYGVPVVLTGSQKEKPVIDEIAGFLEEKEFINMAGKTGLGELVYMIKKADILITNDSGPMHIATATGTPVLAVFGPTTKKLGFFPYGKNSVVLEKDLLCRPCSPHGSRKCPRGHFLCMNMIKVRDVLNEVEKILKYKYE